LGRRSFKLPTDVLCEQLGKGPAEPTGGEPEPILDRTGGGNDIERAGIGNQQLPCGWIEPGT